MDPTSLDSPSPKGERLDWVFNPANFVPPVLGDYLGDTPRAPAQIKAYPEDFVVEERQPSHLCTVGPEPDLTEEQIASFKGELVGATLVKRQLTTYEACLRLARRLGIHVSQISFGGMKDRWAVTAQRVVISGVTLNAVRAACEPKVLHGTGFFIKDVAPAEKPLRQGHLEANSFQLRVVLPGKTREEIEAAVAPRISLLSQRNWEFPNFYGRQRLGRRQNLTKIGFLLMSQGAETAIKTYLTETSDLENTGATAVRENLIRAWQEAEAIAAEKGETVAEQDCQFLAMKWDLDRYSSLNLANEYTLVKRTLEHRNFNDVLRLTKEKITGLWVGAWQGFWFNQALEMYMNGQIQLSDGKIPLYIKDEATEQWYRQNSLGDAIIRNLDPFVQGAFLKVPNRRGDHRSKKRKGHPGKSGHPCQRRGNACTKYGNEFVPETPGPRRNAFIRAAKFRYEIEDGQLLVRFELESGGYATSLMQMLVDLATGDDAVSDERAIS